MDMEFDRVRRVRKLQLLEDGEALAVPASAETRMRDASYASAPGAMAVLSMTAFLVSLVLTVCRLFGVPISVVWILSPMWGSAFLILAVTLAFALWEAGKDARAWVKRRGL